MDLKLTKFAIEYLQSQVLTEKEILEWLQQENRLNNDEKLLVYSYLRDKPVIHDRELPQLFSMANSDIDKLAILIGAWRSEQYHRYMLHLLISFVVNDKTIHYVSTDETGYCGITGKEVYGLKKWNDITAKGGDDMITELNNKDHLAITNSINNQTDQMLSKEGLIYLHNLYEFLNYIDPNFMKHS